MLHGFIKGLKAYPLGLRQITQHGLWAYLLLPILTSVLLGIALFGSAWTLGDDIGQYISQWYPWETGKEWIEKIANVLGGLVVLVLGGLTFRYLVMVLCAPFLSLLSEQLEARLDPLQKTIPFSILRMVQDILRGLRLALRNISLELLMVIPLLVLSLIPILTPFTAVLIFIVQAYFAGFGNLDFWLERHGNINFRVSWIRQNKGLTIANGSVYLLLLLTGVGFLLAPTLGVIAATTAGIETKK